MLSGVPASALAGANGDAKRQAAAYEKVYEAAAPHRLLHGRIKHCGSKSRVKGELGALLCGVDQCLGLSQSIGLEFASCLQHRVGDRADM
jgi:hypothetical protein